MVQYLAALKSGTGTARQEVVTTAEKIALPEGAEIQIFKTKSAFKDVTKSDEVLAEILEMVRIFALL